MSVIDQVRALLRPGGAKKKPATAAEIAEAAGQASEALREAEERLARLRRERADVLLLESAERLQEHDAAIKAAEQEIETLRAMIPRLRALGDEAQVREAIEAVPGLLRELTAATAEVHRARDEFMRARARLGSVVSRVRHAVGVAEQAKRVADLPELDVAVESRVNDAAQLTLAREPGRAFEWPRLPTPRDTKHVVVTGTGEFQFVGEWSESERRDWLRKHGGLGPRRHDWMHDAGGGVATGAAAAAADAARILNAGKVSSGAGRPRPGDRVSVPRAGSDEAVAARILNAGRPPAK